MRIQIRSDFGLLSRAGDIFSARKWFVPGVKDEMARRAYQIFRHLAHSRRVEDG